jgi:hypothetical protein
MHGEKKKFLITLFVLKLMSLINSQEILNSKLKILMKWVKLSTTHR